MYRIFVTEEFQKSLKKLPKSKLPSIEKKVKEFIAPQLKEEPHFGLNIKKLRNYNPETWRYRIGKYRLFYIIHEETKTVSFLTVDHRKDAY